MRAFNEAAFERQRLKSQALWRRAQRIERAGYVISRAIGEKGIQIAREDRFLQLSYQNHYCGNETGDIFDDWEQAMLELFARRAPPPTRYHTHYYPDYCYTLITVVAIGTTYTRAVDYRSHASRCAWPDSPVEKFRNEWIEFFKVPTNVDRYTNDYLAVFPQQKKRPAHQMKFAA